MVGVRVPSNLPSGADPDHPRDPHTTSTLIAGSWKSVHPELPNPATCADVARRAQCLLAQVRGRDVASGTTPVPTSLVVRASTAPPPG